MESALGAAHDPIFAVIAEHRAAVIAGAAALYMIDTPAD
jgi:hypothetical protein